MSDSHLNQNTSEEKTAQEAEPATSAAPASEETTKHKTFTRRTVLAMAGCGVAGLVAGGVLASWGVTSASIASGRIEIRTTPTKMIVTDRARCSGCQRCEMACTLKNDGRVCQHIARVRVWDNYNFGTNPGSGDGSYANCQFTVEHCKQCADAACMNYCPVHAIYASEDNGARMVDTDRCIGCGMCAQACRGTCRASTASPACPRSAFRAVAAPSSARTAPSSSSIGRISPRRSSTRAS